MFTEEQIKAIIQENERLRKENDALSGKMASLEQSLYWLRKKMFGRMSEKNLPLDPNQLSLFTQQEMSPDEKAGLEEEARKAEEEMTRTIKVKDKPVRKPLDTSLLPVKEINLYPEGTTTEDGGLKDDFVEIGTEETLRLERIPEKVYIVKTIRHKVIRKSELKEKHPEERHILISPLPLVPVGKCMAGASVLTDIIIGKFMYHLPFYRLIQQYRESGITISDSTMGGWYEAAVEKLKLLYNLLKKQILSSEYIQIDESVIPVIDNEKHKTKKGYEWCLRDGITGDVTVTVAVEQKDVVDGVFVEADYAPYGASVTLSPVSSGDDGILPNGTITVFYTYRTTVTIDGVQYEGNTTGSFTAAVYTNDDGSSIDHVSVTGDYPESTIRGYAVFTDAEGNSYYSTFFTVNVLSEAGE